MIGSNNDPRADALRSQAAEWLVRVQSDAATEEDWLALEEWLSASSEHRDALHEAELIWREFDDSAGALVAASSKPSERATAVSRQRRVTRPSRWFYGAMAASLAVAFVALWAFHSAGPRPQTYVTAAGETRTLLLADGTRIHLNGASRLTVAVDRRRRHVALEDGEAAFDVFHDPDHAFVVAVADQRVTVLGTEFDILRSQGRVGIAVRRGTVRVQTIGGAAPAPAFELTRGEQSQHTEGAAGSSVTHEPPDDAFAWIDGYVTFQDRPLSEVASDLSRHFAAPIMVEGAAANLRFSGTLILDSEDTVVDRLKSFLPIKAVRRPGAIVLSLK